MAGVIVPIGASLTGLQRGIAEAQGMIRGIGSKLQSIKMPSWAGAVSLGGAFAGLKVALDDLDRVGDIAKRFGASAEDIQRLGYVAKLSGSDVEAMAKSLTILTKNLGAQGAAGDKARTAIQDMGINLQQFMNAGPVEKMALLADAFVAGGSDAEAFAGTLELIGAKTGAELIPALADGGAAFRQMASEAKVASNATVAAVQQMNDQLDSIWAGLKTEMADVFGKAAFWWKTFLSWDPRDSSLGDHMNAALRELDLANVPPPRVAPDTGGANPYIGSIQWHDAEIALIQDERSRLEAELKQMEESAKVQDKADAMRAKEFEVYLKAQEKLANQKPMMDSIGAALASLQGSVSGMVSSLHKIGGGGNSGFSLSDMTNTLIKTQTATLGSKLDKVEVAIKNLKLGGTTAWA